MRESSPPSNRETLLNWLAAQGLNPNDIAPGSFFSRLMSGRKDAAARRSQQSKTNIGDPVRVFMVLCQKMSSTGSGIVVKEMVERSDAFGVEYAVLCGGYQSDDLASTLPTQADRIEQVSFKSDSPDGLPFPIVGMSNQMPYESMAFKDLTLVELEAYLQIWAQEIRRMARAFRPDVIHVHHLWLLSALATLVCNDLPIVVSVHGTDLFRAQDTAHLTCLVEPWVPHFSKVIALTRDSVALARSIYPSDETLFEVFGNGFNQRLFHPNRVVEPNILEKYGLSRFKSKRVVLCVAKYDKRKGIEWLLRAYARLPARDLSSSVLVIAGTGPSGERQRYSDLAKQLGIANHVALTGAVQYEHVGALMNSASVFVLPSYHEPFGLVLLEALACGCRVVATDQGGPATFIPAELRNRGDATLVPGLPALDADWAAIESFVARLTQALAVQLAKPINSRIRSEISTSVDQLTWDAYVRRLGRLYRQVAVMERER